MIAFNINITNIIFSYCFKSLAKLKLHVLDIGANKEMIDLFKFIHRLYHCYNPHFQKRDMTSSIGHSLKIMKEHFLLQIRGMGILLSLRLIKGAAVV